MPAKSGTQRANNMSRSQWSARIYSLKAVSTRRIGSAGPAIGTNSNRPSSAKQHPKVGRDRNARILGGEGRAGTRYHGMHAHCPSPCVHVHPAPSHSTHVTQIITGECLLRETRVMYKIARRRCTLRAAAYPASYEPLGAVHGHKRPPIREVRWSCTRGLTGD